MRFSNVLRQSGRYRDRTCDPFRVKEDDHSSNCLSGQDVTTIGNPACTTACTKSTESSLKSADEQVAVPESNHFAAALLMIAGLPLSDADKAEAVKRLLRGNG